VPTSTRAGLEKNGAHQDQAIGRSRGGLTTKIHACVDALGNPIRLILTAGQVADVTQGAALIERFDAGAVIADKGYDSDALVQIIEAAGAQAIIPPRSHRKTSRTVDWHRYKARNLVERFFCRLKQFRRLATRYEKLAARFNAFLQLASAYIWLM
jgi:transposase